MLLLFLSSTGMEYNENNNNLNVALFGHALIMCSYWNYNEANK